MTEMPSLDPESRNYISCPHCTIQIPADVPECPYCRQPVPGGTRPGSRRTSADCWFPRNGFRGSGIYTGNTASG